VVVLDALVEFGAKCDDVRWDISEFTSAHSPALPVLRNKGVIGYATVVATALISF
jgi:hypothetical protein